MSSPTRNALAVGAVALVSFAPTLFGLATGEAARQGGGEARPEGSRLAPEIRLRVSDDRRTSPQAQGVEGLTWLTGGWILERDGDLLEEHWSRPRRGTMVGWFRWLTSEGLRLTEHVTITDEGDGTVFRLRHFSPEMVPWEAPDSAFRYPMTSVNGMRAVFTNPERDQPRSFVFERTATDSLVVRVIGGGEARGDTMVFRYGRVDGSS